MSGKWDGPEKKEILCWAERRVTGGRRAGEEDVQEWERASVCEYESRHEAGEGEEEAG